MAESTETEGTAVEKKEGKVETVSAIKVLVAIDGKPHTLDALEWYAKYIHRPGNELLMAHCSSVKVPDYNASPGLMKEVRFKAEAMDSEIGRVAQERITPHGITGKFITLVGKPSEALVEAIHERHVNLVIVGSRQVGKLKKKMSGSVSSHVIHHSHVPVLVYPGKKAEKEHGDHKHKK